MKYIIKVTATGQFLRVLNNKVSYVNHMSDATRFDSQPTAERAKACVPYALAPRRLEVRR